MERSIEEIKKTYQQYTPEVRGYEAGGVNADVLYLLCRIEELTRTNRTAAECIDRLRIELDDVNTAHDRDATLALNLYTENKRMRDALTVYADRDNWGKYERIDNYFIWIYSTRKGWEIAEAALKGNDHV